MLVDHYMGKRLNTPNDCVLGPDGSIYFTDPPYGLVNRNAGPDRDLDYMGIFRLAPDNSLHLLDTMTTAERDRRLSGRDKALFLRRPHRLGDVGPRQAGERLKPPPVRGPQCRDGRRQPENRLSRQHVGGNPRRVTVFTPGGERIGFISADQGVSNCEIGADGYLYLASSTRVLRVRTKAKSCCSK